MTSLKKTTRIRSIVNSAIQFAEKHVLHSQRKTRIITITALFLTICTFGATAVAPLAPDASDLPVTKIVEDLHIPNLDEQIQALENRAGTYIYEEKVKRGDTLAALLHRLGVEDSAANKFIQSNATARLVMQQQAGKTVRAQTNENGELLWLQTHFVNNTSQLKSITVTRQQGTSSFHAAESKLSLERRIEMKSGDIATSLFAATDAAHIPDAIANQMVDMFSTDIDFSSDLKRGDHFQLMYETFWQNGEMVGTGKVIAGEFKNNHRLYQIAWFADPKGGGSYYSFDGKSMKKAFLKSPIAFTRISSGFAMRVHPLSGRWTKHNGVDFAAPSGTPIHAAADGVVQTAGKSGGYGNMVTLKHGKTYTTLYAHMSRFAPGMHKGAKVKQGEVIGYVGATGWATAPHLHYEFRANNQALDPLKIKVEQSRTLASSDLVRFKATIKDVKHRFALMRPMTETAISTQVALR